MLIDTQDNIIKINLKTIHIYIYHFSLLINLESPFWFKILIILCNKPISLHSTPLIGPIYSLQVPDTSQLKHVLEGYLSDYNLVHKSSLSLVLTDYLIQHVARISRVLKQEGGHLMLLGVTGCGRKSSAKLAAFISGCELMEVSMLR